MITVIIPEWETETTDIILEPWRLSCFIHDRLVSKGIPVKSTFGFDVTPSRGTLEFHIDYETMVRVYGWKP